MRPRICGPPLCWAWLMNSPSRSVSRTSSSTALLHCSHSRRVDAPSVNRTPSWAHACFSATSVRIPGSRPSSSFSQSTVVSVSCSLLKSLPRLSHLVEPMSTKPDVALLWTEALPPPPASTGSRRARICRSMFQPEDRPRGSTRWTTIVPDSCSTLTSKRIEASEGGISLTGTGSAPSTPGTFTVLVAPSLLPTLTSSTGASSMTQVTQALCADSYVWSTSCGSTRRSQKRLPLQDPE